VTTALARPVRYDLETFATAAGLHPDLIVRLERIGLIMAVRDDGGRWWFEPAELTVVSRIRRLRAGFGLNYAALGLVLDLLDRVEALESRTARQHPSGGRLWT
jgi:DNA-binding transcriptional MerR regulator